MWVNADDDPNAVIIDRNQEEAVQHFLQTLLGSVEAMEQIDVVFLGYPIWNMTVSQAIQPLLSVYDFSGTIVLPFCSSGGSGLRRTGEILVVWTDKTVNWIEDSRLSASTTAEEISAWLTEKGVEPYMPNKKGAILMHSLASTSQGVRVFTGSRIPFDNHIEGFYHFFLFEYMF